LLALLVLPLVALVVRTPPAILLNQLGEPATRQALRLSLETSLASTAGVILLGTPLAYLLARTRFKGIQALEVLIDLPTVLPPAVAGLGLLMAFGRRGLLGGVLHALGLSIPFTPLAVVLAQAFVAAPYYVKTAAVGLALVSREQEQAAGLDGASPLRVFRYVTLPQSIRSLVAGVAMCWARAIGEFGATLMFAGNLAGRTQTMPLAVYQSFEVDLQRSLALAVILLTLSFGLLILVRLILPSPSAER
jgi:molybdate transport system permease protein